MIKKVLICLGVVLFVVLCFIFNKYDLDISIYLTRFDGPFFEFFDDYGELPIYIGPVLFGSTYFYLVKKKKYKALCAGITYIGYSIASVKVFENKDFELTIPLILICALIALLLASLTIYLFSKISLNTLEKIKDIALLSLLVTIISIGVVGALKLTWGRVRFRDLSVDYHEFTNLFTINGYTGHSSFPSGHTNAGTSILILSLLVSRLAKNKAIKYLTTILCFAYILLLAVSRIIVSAHYASDVMCGFMVGFTTLCLTYYILKRKGVIKNAPSN